MLGRRFRGAPLLEIFGDDAVAMVDRLVHHAELISLKGEGDSYRLKDRDLGLARSARQPKRPDRSPSAVPPRPAERLYAGRLERTRQRDKANGILRPYGPEPGPASPARHPPPDQRQSGQFSTGASGPAFNRP